MNRQPTGTVSAAASAAGRDLTITRTYRAPVDDVWAAITESERCGRWFATWTGDAFAGGAITLQMTAEGDDVPPATGHISTCGPRPIWRWMSRTP